MRNFTLGQASTLPLLLSAIALTGCSELIDASNATYTSGDAETGFDDRVVVESATSNPGDNFGTAIALEGDELIVVAPTAELSGTPSAAEATCGESVDLKQAGRIHVFEHEDTAWIESEELQRDRADNTEGLVKSAAFASLPRISIVRAGATVVIGIPAADMNHCAGADSAAKTAAVEAKQAGKVQVFERAGDQWIAGAVLRASDPSSDDFFGANVALRGDELFVGAPGADSSAVDDGGNPIESSGAVYVFARDGDTWRQRQLIEPSNPLRSAFFGSALSVDDDSLAVGAWLDSHAGSGINPGSQTELLMSGAAYVFRKRDGRWEQEAYIKAFNSDAQDAFGMSIAIEKDTLLIGAPAEDSGHGSADAVGLGLDSVNRNDVEDAGAVYVYRRSGSAWSLDTYLKAFEPREHSAFGVALSIHSGRILVGAPDQPALAVDGDEEIPDVGAAYLYERRDGKLVPSIRFAPAVPRREALFGFSTALSDHVAVIGAPANTRGPGQVDVFDF